MAELVNVYDKHISCIESGKYFSSPDLIERLAVVFDVEPKDFFEFYYLQDEKDLKADIMKMVNSLGGQELSLILKYI